MAEKNNKLSAFEQKQAEAAWKEAGRERKMEINRNLAWGYF